MHRTTETARIHIAFKVVSRARRAKILPFKQRMGWSFDWVSSHGCSFNEDFNVSFGPGHKAEDKVFYNFHETNFPADEAPGASVFAKDGDGAVYHTYSTYGRGLDVLNGAYAYMDLAPLAATRLAKAIKWAGCAITTVIRAVSTNVASSHLGISRALAASEG